MAHLPATGDSNWGTPLNSYITTVVLAQANAAAASIASHQAGSDPHGDRAYALGLVAPLTTGVNGPNGFLQLNSIGKIPNAQLPAGGGRTSAFDVVKDYSAPTNGTAASAQIQSALNDCGTSGGGEVWVGDGNYGIDSALYCPSNVWLHLSPGATMTRIVNTTSGLAPTYMVANFNGSVSGSGSTNILIEGGKWVFDGPSATGIPMAFVGGDSITVRATSIRTLAQCAPIMFAGCTNSQAVGVQFSTAAPASARSAYLSAPPAVRIETAASSVIAGLNSGMYTNAACNNIAVTACSITGATASDGTGLYGAISGIAGTVAAVSSSFHQNIQVLANAAIALPASGVYATNWQTCIITNNQLNLNNGSAAVTGWSPSQPGTSSQVIANNSSAGTTGALAAYKTGNTSRSSTTTPSNDPDLQVSVASNAVYEVRASIAYFSTSTTPDIKYDFSLPSGTMNYTASRTGTAFNPGFGGGSDYTAQTVSNSAGSSDVAITDPGNTDYGIQVMGILVTGGTAGTFGFKWSQNSNSGTALQVLAGSYLTLSRIA
jgi:hypothetical protein